MIRLPIKEWQCKYAVINTCITDGKYRAGRTPDFSCAIKEMTRQNYYERGCFGSECCHNAESDDNKGKPFYGRCPFVGDGKCTCMEDDGSSKWCDQGEKKFTANYSCGIGWGDPLGCRFFKKLEYAEMMLLAINYYDDFYFFPFTRANQGKCWFQPWYRDMLKELGAPKELYEFGYVSDKKEGKEKYSAARKKLDEMFKSWLKNSKEKKI